MKQRGAINTTLNYLNRTLKHAGPFIEEWAQVPQLNTDVAVDANLNWEMAGTNAASLTAGTHSTGGGIKMLTAGADNDQVILSPHVDAQQSALNTIDFQTDDECYIGTRIATDSLVTTMLIHFGFDLTPTTLDETTDADQAFFSFDTDNSDTTWMANWSVGGTDTEYNTGIAVSASTAYTLAISIDADRVAHFFINSKREASSAALTSGVDFKPFLGIQALATAARTLYCRKIIVGKGVQTN
tara:strand:+ start:845 stop:1570 length:726 start_codon:yes stop_codon:yes gene_type:complete